MVGGWRRWSIPNSRGRSARSSPRGNAGSRSPGRSATLLPGGGLRRGATVTVDGVAGSGATSVALALAAAATQAGEWAAIVDPYGTLGARAAADGGCRARTVRGDPALPGRSLEHGGRRVARRRRAGGGDGSAAVAAGRRAPAWSRARVERASVLVALGPWPVEASMRLYAEGGAWSGLGDGCGALDTRELHVRVEAKGAPARGNVRALAGVAPMRTAVDHADVLCVVPGLAGGRGAPPRSRAAHGAGRRARTDRESRPRARRVGRGARRTA